MTSLFLEMLPKQVASPLMAGQELINHIADRQRHSSHLLPQQVCKQITSGKMEGQQLARIEVFLGIKQ